MKRLLPALLAFVALALAVAGCGGTTPERTIARDDLPSIVGPPPDTPAGATYSDNGFPLELTPADLRARAQTPADRATFARLEKSGFTALYQRSYTGAVNNADATAYLFRTPAGAGDAFADLKTSLARQATADQKLSEVPADGMGDEAWGAHLAGGSEAALFLFRVSNLVLVTDMSCDSSCDVDIVSAARSYAEAIASRASDVAG